MSDLGAFGSWLYRHHFKCKEVDCGKNFLVECQLCLPDKKTLSASKESTSNLKKHLQRKHAAVYNIALPKRQKDDTSKCSLEDSPSLKQPKLDTAVQHCSHKRRKHCNQYQDPTLKDETGDHSGSLSTSGCDFPGEGSSDCHSERPAKQARINCYIRTVTQRKVDALVFNFMVDAVQPFSLLEQPSFLMLVEGLQPSRGLVSSKVLEEKVSLAFQSMEQVLCSELRGVSHTCTAVDIWTAQGRSHLGVTCHWIEESTLERKSAALACATVLGSPTSEVVVTKLNEIHCRFGLQSKVCSTLTDSGSCPVSAFAEFLGEKPWELPTANFEDVRELLDSDVKELQFLLPPHRRCASAVLGRIAQREVERALGVGPVQSLYLGAMAKCAAIWKGAHSLSWRIKALEDLANMKSTVANSSRWSVEFRGVQKILAFSESQMQEAFQSLCLETFTSQEILFLQEYVEVLQPMAFSIEFIRSEKKCFLGNLLPTLLTLRMKLNEMKPFVRFTAHLIDALLASVDSQFDAVMSSREAKMAAVTVPKFRLWWLPAEQREEMRRALVEEAMLEEQRAGLEGRASRPPGESDSESEDRFFGFPPSQGEKKSTAEVEVSNYLQDTDKSLSSLSRYHIVRQLFLKYNTALPSGIGVERLFTRDGRVLTPGSCGIREDYFEQVLLLRYNQNMCPLVTED